MNILITHVYSRGNKGDAAILTVMKQQIKSAFPHSSITILTAEKIKTRKNFVNSFLYHCLYKYENNFFKVISIIYTLIISTIWAMGFGIFKSLSFVLLPSEIKKTCKAFAEADLILPVGGGYLNGKNNLKSTLVLIIQLHSLLVGQLLHKKTILYSQSIGPFGNNMQRFLASNILQKVDGIIARENITIKTLGDLKIHKSRIHKSVDSAFLFRSNKKIKIPQIPRINKSSYKIGITVRNWLPINQQKRFEENIANFCKYLIETKHAHILLIPQVISTKHNDDDRIASKRVKNLIKNHNVTLINKNYTHYEIKHIYKSLDYLIGTRMHSVIFAITENVPSIAIEYEYKTRGIMKDLGLESYVINIEEVTTSKLINLFNKLENKKTGYKFLLRTSIKAYRVRANLTPQIVKDIYMGRHTVL